MPPKTEYVELVGKALPPELRSLVTLAASTGMRQGECFGLTVDRVDLLDRTVVLDRQMILFRSGKRSARC
ncbi:hypothetical protein [Mycolicibacterium sp. P1-5]|uniref:hypothetical protein n=1 Tax=Mycolicibacterium sp. P1-5 TaxID=2024617 RepID=UPI001883B77C|nr:hypothetical protein [Mycolicibacterium sp. P1-5]